MNALDELRESLRAAASRDVEASQARSRRRRRRATGAIVAVLLGGAAAAGAADLISVGEPIPDSRVQEANYKPRGGNGFTIAVTAPSEDPKLPYGVGLYTANNGARCAVAGQVRGFSLGAVERGTFRPYTTDRIGVCAKPGRPTYGAITYRGRSLVFGITGKGDRTVRVAGTSADKEVGPERAFLFVFDRPVPRESYVVIIE